MGSMLMAFYDVFRIFRRVIPHNLFWISLEDFIYWVSCTILVFLVLHEENYGKWDYAVILAALTGMLSYRYLVGKWVVKPISGALRFCLMQMKKWKNRLTGPIKKFMIKLCKRLKLWGKGRILSYKAYRKTREQGVHEKETGSISKKEKR
ncbi:MAG: hypothetical protein E7285_06835 [Lachnospiraceae bacterium]|nr:hypothetical protein [Lachnospiraceae bacterium]